MSITCSQRKLHLLQQGRREHLLVLNGGGRFSFKGDARSARLGLCIGGFITLNGRGVGTALYSRLN